MNWEQLNEVLKDLNSLRNGRTSATKVASQSDGDDYQPTTEEVYKLSDEVYIKVTVQTDSYGDNELIKGIEFVQPKQTLVTEFESSTGKINKDGKLTYEQILEVIKDEEDSVSEFAYTGNNSDYLGLGEVKQLDSHGGEDEGSDWWRVYHFTKHDIYIKVSGYYQSYSGTEFDGWDDACEQVKPAQKMVTVFE